MTVLSDLCRAMIIVAGFLLLTACASQSQQQSNPQQTDPSTQSVSNESLRMMSTGAGIGLARLGGMAF
jgi:uncharacterized lipoprotein YajG